MLPRYVIIQILKYFGGYYELRGFWKFIYTLNLVSKEWNDNIVPHLFLSKQPTCIVNNISDLKKYQFNGKFLQLSLNINNAKLERFYHDSPMDSTFHQNITSMKLDDHCFIKQLPSQLKHLQVNIEGDILKSPFNSIVTRLNQSLTSLQLVIGIEFQLTSLIVSNCQYNLTQLILLGRPTMLIPFKNPNMLNEFTKLQTLQIEHLYCEVPSLIYTLKTMKSLKNFEYFHNYICIATQLFQDVITTHQSLEKVKLKTTTLLEMDIIISSLNSNTVLKELRIQGTAIVPQICCTNSVIEIFQINNCQFPLWSVPSSLREIDMHHINGIQQPNLFEGFYTIHPQCEQISISIEHITSSLIAKTKSLNMKSLKSIVLYMSTNELHTKDYQWISNSLLTGFQNYHKLLFYPRIFDSIQDKHGLEYTVIDIRFEC
ncbi:hypothetical protein DLAC_05178 [Tieghemostelium lacteum]|uniref:Uncharacterized protein n=1 Tax=Tieghemostelium lacteum TaxID=361077 RepID=A0A151ZIQ2_TIELA|nr:hypothetical protein DLAC_05178 [Tieghemostelium lacteum]|eukprot:KYQ93785.1 hypothetical protein DLAC_05178 [Tieghemostelium lacteum]